MLAVNDFALFGLTPSFDLDQEDLQRRHHTMLAKIHPDRFASAHEQDKRIAVQLTAKMNEAFARLNNPLSRAKYLFSIKFPEELLDRIAVSNDFLMKQAQWYEQLEDNDNINELAQNLRLQKERIFETLKHHFAAYPNEVKMNDLGQVINELSFVNKLEDALLEKTR